MAFNCTACNLHSTCSSNLIDSSGPANAKIMFVVDTPSQADDEQNELLVGDHGAKFDYLLRWAKIKRRNVHITSAIRCKPPRGKEPKAENIIACQRHILKEILSVRPKVIVAMGNIAMQSLMNVKGITDYRGVFDEIEIDYRPKLKTGKRGKQKTFRCQVMPTFSPSSCLAKWENDKVVVHDLKKVKNYLQTGEVPKEPEVKVNFVTDLKTLESVKKKLVQAKKWFFDFETTSLSFHNGEIIQAGFCITPGEVFVIPFREYKPEETKKFDQENLDMVEKVNGFVRKNKKKIKQTFKEIFRSPAKKMAHNGKFDVKWARKFGFPVKNFWFDTCIAHALCDENAPHNIYFLLDWFNTGYHNYEMDLWPYVNKTKQNKKPYSYVPPLILAKYLGKDVDGPMRVQPKMYDWLKKEGMTRLFFKQQMPLVRLMADLEFRGVKLDIPRLQEISKDFAVILADIDKKIKKATKDPKFNPNSPKQLQEYLSDIGAIGNSGDKKTKSGGFSTDESVLSKLANHKKKSFRKVPKLILESRTIGKLKSNYLDGKDGQSGMLSWVDHKGMVHYSSNIHTPRTGRMSVNDPAIQTIPRPNPKYPKANIRQLFIPSEPERVMFSVDFAQLEMRIAAFLSRDPVMIQEIREGVDMHSRNAVTLATKVGMLPRDVTEEQFIKALKYEPPTNWEQFKSEVKRERIKRKVQRAMEWKELRVLVKSLGFGLNYGMEASTLAKDHGRDEEEMQEMIDAYFDKYDHLAMWREEQKDKAIDEGVLVLPETGRKRRFFDAARWFNSEFSQDMWKRSMDIDSVHRQAMNFPIQGFANEIFVAGKLKFYRALRKQGFQGRILLSLHDGILGDCPKSEVHAIKELANECLERTLGKGTKHEVKLTVDFEVYDRWSGTQIDLKKVAV